jgi:hypothetical protein
MKPLTLILAVVFLLPAAGPRKTIFLDKMSGFEAYIEQAIKDNELHIEVLTEEEHPDLKAMIGNRFKSLYAEALFRKHTGRDEDTEITLVDVKTGKKILVHQFRMGSTDDAKRRAATTFVDELKRKLGE